MADDFNKTEETFNGIYTYPKELYTEDLSVGMKTILEENGIHPHPFKFVCGMQQCTTQFDNKAQHIDHVEKFYKKEHFKINYDEYLISQVSHNDFHPVKLNPEGSEVGDKKFWEERIRCIYQDCDYPNNAMERSHIKDLLSGTEFEPTDLQTIILDGMNPIWRYLVISEFRKKHKNIFGDMRLANFKMKPEKSISKKGKG
jgi:hypothetical protein